MGRRTACRPSVHEGRRSAPESAVQTGVPAGVCEARRSGAMSDPRIAFFTDSLHEVNGVALTSRNFVRFARENGKEFFAVCAGPGDRHFKEGTFEAVELARSRFLIRLERDLSFDLLFYRHHAALDRKLRAFRPNLIHIT